MWTLETRRCVHFTRSNFLSKTLTLYQRWKSLREYSLLVLIHATLVDGSGAAIWGWVAHWPLGSPHLCSPLIRRSLEKGSSGSPMALKHLGRPWPFILWVRLLVKSGSVGRPKAPKSLGSQHFLLPLHRAVRQWGGGGCPTRLTVGQSLPYEQKGPLEIWELMWWHQLHQLKPALVIPGLISIFYVTLLQNPIAQKSCTIAYDFHHHVIYTVVCLFCNYWLCSVQN